MRNTAKLAILIDDQESYPPSNKKTLDYIASLYKEQKIHINFVSKTDLRLLKEYSGLFIRTLTDVKNETYQWALFAEFLNIKVLDTSKSISLGSDKHLQFELCKKKKIAVPETQIIYRNNIQNIEKELTLSFPLVLKIPSGSFSNGVYKIDNKKILKHKLTHLFKKEKLYSIILQKFMFTQHDWRVAILDHQPLFLCKYYMVHKHWQIIKYKGKKMIEGQFETLPICQMPKKVAECVKKVLPILGSGLYGLDLKLYNNKAYLIEINDNPNICLGMEDLIEKEKIYLKILKYLMPHV